MIMSGLRFEGHSNMRAFEESLHQINAGLNIPEDLAKASILDVLNSSDKSQDACLGALLVGSMRVASPDMVRGFVRGIIEFEDNGLMDDRQRPEGFDDEVIVGCAGSGKKGIKTINITTPAMIVASSVGAKVLKTGSSSTSSLTGSRDILELSGVSTPRTQEQSNALFGETGFGFYSIEDMIPKFDHVYGGKFFAPHSLSLALPAALIPVEVDQVMYGYAGPNTALSAECIVASTTNKKVLTFSNTQDGERFIDEIASVGSTRLSGTLNGMPSKITEIDMVDYYDLGTQSPTPISSACSKEGQLHVFDSILRSQLPGSVAENTVLINAATMIYMAGIVPNPKEGFVKAQDVVRSGVAMDKFMQIKSASKRIVSPNERVA
jgi:anthranilate phosphoribosyltransferase